MGILRCDGCGEEFSIGHDPAFVDKWLAEKQAYWLEKALAEEHDPDRIELPGLICIHGLSRIESLQTCVAAQSFAITRQLRCGSWRG
jgi:hypothetical protein